MKPAKPVKRKGVPLSRRHNWPRRGDIIDRYMRLVFFRLERAGELSSAHNLGHVSRVSNYARKYVEFMGGSEPLQQQARIAGKSHDRIREPTEEVSHEGRSGAFMQGLFEGKSKEAGKPDRSRHGKEAISRMSRAIKLHGTAPKPELMGRDIVREGVFYADKFFEANGAYIAFRRPMFMGERLDRRKEAKKRGFNLRTKKGREEAAIAFTLDETKIRVAKFSNLSKIPKSLHGFVEYQVGWQKRLRAGLEKRAPWAVNLSTVLFSEGLKKRPKSLDEMIKNYKPIGEEDARFKNEAIRYFNGDLWKEFEKRVKL